MSDQPMPVPGTQDVTPIARRRIIGPRTRGVEPPAFEDVCTDPGCGTCAIWQQPDETREQWQARIREAYAVALFQHESEAIA